MYIYIDILCKFSSRSLRSTRLCQVWPSIRSDIDIDELQLPNPPAVSSSSNHNPKPNSKPNLKPNPKSNGWGKVFANLYLWRNNIINIHRSYSCVQIFGKL